MKEAELGVPPALAGEHGAVSAETAAAMAAGVRARLGADVGVAVTGIAGPGRRHARRSRSGSSTCTPRRPEADAASSSAFPSDRETIRSRATVAALHLLRRLLSQNRDIRV